MTTPVRWKSLQNITQELSFLSSVHEPWAIVSPVDSHHSQGGRKGIDGRYVGRKLKSAIEVFDHVLPIYGTLSDPSEYKAIMKQASFIIYNMCVPYAPCYSSVKVDSS
jgi:hypothetical protein